MLLLLTSHVQPSRFERKKMRNITPIEAGLFAGLLTVAIIVSIHKWNGGTIFADPPVATDKTK